MWQQSFHRRTRKIFPFFYIRNWYTGQFEFSMPRFVYTLVALGVLIVLVVCMWWLGGPVEYTTIPHI